LFTIVKSPSKQDCTDTSVIMAWPIKICLTGIYSVRAPGCPHLQRQVYLFIVLCLYQSYTGNDCPCWFIISSTKEIQNVDVFISIITNLENYSALFLDFSLIAFGY